MMIIGDLLQSRPCLFQLPIIFYLFLKFLLECFIQVEATCLLRISMWNVNEDFKLLLETQIASGNWSWKRFTYMLYRTVDLLFACIVMLQFLSPILLTYNNKYCLVVLANLLLTLWRPQVVNPSKNHWRHFRHHLFLKQRNWNTILRQARQPSKLETRQLWVRLFTKLELLSQS